MQAMSLGTMGVHTPDSGVSACWPAPTGGDRLSSPPWIEGKSSALSVGAPSVGAPADFIPARRLLLKETRYGHTRIDRTTPT